MAISVVAQNETFDTWRTRLNETIARWNNLGEYDAIVITGGTIDNTEIGGTTPSVGTFTNLEVSSTFDATGATLILPDDSISGDKIDGGDMDVDNIVLGGDPLTDNHATRKSYVDGEIAAAQQDSIALIIGLS